VALWGLKRSNEISTAIIYALAGSLGFAALENVLYVLGAGSSGVMVAFLRAIMTVPLHCTTGIVIGTGLGLRKFGVGPKADQPWWKVLRFPVFIHGSFNFCLISGPYWATMFFGGSMVIAFLFVFMAFTVFFLSFIYSLAVWAREDFIAVPCCVESCLTCPLQGTLCPWTAETREQVRHLQIARATIHNGVLPVGVQNEQQGTQMVNVKSTHTFRIQVPPDAVPGQTITVEANGRLMNVELPLNSHPGQTLDVEL
jgi:hypothetical protein